MYYRLKGVRKVVVFGLEREAGSVTWLEKCVCVLSGIEIFSIKSVSGDGSRFDGSHGCRI